MTRRTACRLDEVEISVVRRGEPGDLPSLVLLPGTGLTAQDWGVVADDLAGDRVVHAVDLRGHGRSSWPGRYSVDLMAQDVRRLVLEDVGLLRSREPATPQRPEGVLDFDWRVAEQVRPEIDWPAAHWPATVATITAPTLVVAGGATSFVPQDSITDLVELLPDGRVVTIDAGHEVHAARPADFVSTLRAFLAGLA